jgi:DNA polymerase-3 subunit delta
MKADILHEVRNGKCSPAYLLSGPEGFSRQEAFQTVMKELPEGTRDFNLDMFQGTELDWLEVVTAAQTFPVMSPFRLVLVKDVLMKKIKDFSIVRSYLENPSPTTCLMLSTVEELSSSFCRELGKGIVLLTFPKLKPWEVPDAVRDMVRKKGYRITPEACRMLADAVGESLERLNGEIEKLSVFKDEQKTITAEDIEALTGAGREHSIFELFDALSAKDSFSGVRHMRALMRTGEVPGALLGLISSQLRKRMIAHLLVKKGLGETEIARELKITAYRDRFFASLKKFPETEVRIALRGLSAADRILKTTSTPPDFVLENLIAQICASM